MPKTNPNDAAFPTTTEVCGDTGLTKREYFAGHALQGYIAAGFPSDLAIDMAAEVADKFIRKLNDE